jgi:hypothetical protein
MKSVSPHQPAGDVILGLEKQKKGGNYTRKSLIIRSINLLLLGKPNQERQAGSEGNRQI